MPRSSVRNPAYAVMVFVATQNVTDLCFKRRSGNDQASDFKSEGPRFEPRACLVSFCHRKITEIHRSVQTREIGSYGDNDNIYLFNLPYLRENLFNNTCGSARRYT